ncbi:MAG: hypothetical protein HGA80_02745, partial [Candidatus Omnitrophica bacterium]|nr:hypothetical protein [Candidatus Omnitrophota bacterium]
DLLGSHPWFEAEQNNGPVRLELDADTTIAFPGNAKRPVHAGNDLRSEPEIISGALLDLNDTYQPKINNGSWRAWLTNGDRQVRVEADAGRFPWATMWTQWPGIVGMEPTASVRDPFALPQDHPLLQNWIQPGQQKQGQVRYTIITRQDVIKAAQDNRTMTPQELAEKTGASLKFVQDALEAMQKNERLAGLSEHVRDAVNRTMNGEPTGGLSRLRSFLTDMTGIEEGYYIATDWGGTNLRVLLVHAIPGQKPVTLHQYTVKAEFPKNYVAGEVPIEEVMDFVASKIAEMVGKIKSDGDNGKLILQKTLNMGAGFSFPTVVTQEDGEVVVQLEQNNIKGWAFPGLSVEDVKKTGKKAPSLRKLHQDAIDRNPEIRGLVKVMAMPNDVVALGLAIAGSSISFIDGTGFNMGVRNPLTGEWINLEFGAFDDISSGLITDMDRRVFEEVDPGVHKFEKMVSGKYLIELLRRQVADKMAGYTAIQKLFAFPEIDSRILTFAADDKMSIEQKNQGLIEKFGTDLGLKEADWRLLQEPSRYYLARSGELIGAVLSGVLEAIDPERKIESPIIAYDGSAINNPIVMSRVKNKMAETGGRKVEFRTTNDATGIGTAIAAALKPMDAAQQTGGVNLDPAAMDFQIRRDGKGVPLSLSSQPVKDLRIDGFSPRIIGIRPVSVVDLINK